MGKFLRNEADGFLKGEHPESFSEQEAISLGAGADLYSLDDPESEEDGSDTKVDKKDVSLFKVGDQVRLNPDKNVSLFKKNKFQASDVFEVIGIQPSFSGEQLLTVCLLNGSKRPYHYLAKKFIKS